MNRILTVAEAADLIRQDLPLALAGPAAALSQLPAGRWIGGSIPYFMLPEGGTVVTDDRVFVTDLSGLGEVSIASFGPDELQRISGDAPDNGFSLAIVPAGSDAHQRFAADAASYEHAFLRPTVGWIAGVHLDDLGQQAPVVFDGRTPSAHTDRVVVAHVALPADTLASLEIVNLFQPGEGELLQFDDTSFAVRECRVNGETVNFGAWLKTKGLADGRLPLVGDFAGAHINVSIQSIDEASGTVNLYAPVFPGVDYRVARPVADYAGTFRARLADVDPHGVVFGCNCILNFLYGELEGKQIGGVAGPVTFGEIAYQLLNQTLVMVRIQ